MEGYVLDIEKRVEIGRSVTRRLRRDGRIPAIVYHRGEESLAGSVSYKDFTKLASMAKISQVFTFKSGDKSFEGKSALVRDIQLDHLSGKVIHVDFQALKDDEEISVTVPLHFVGDAVGVKTEGGALSVHRHDLEVRCLPKFIPLFIEVDVSAMRLNTHMHAKDLPLPEGVGLAGSGEVPVVSVAVMKEEVETTVATTDATTAAQPAAAAAPAAGDAAKAAAPAKAPAGKK